MVLNDEKLNAGSGMTAEILRGLVMCWGDALVWIGDYLFDNRLYLIYVFMVRPFFRRFFLH